MMQNRGKRKGRGTIIYFLEITAERCYGQLDKMEFYKVFS